MLERLFTSKTRVKLLRLLYSGESSHLREMARRTGINVTQVRRELENLHRLGLLVKTKAGNTHLYSINPHFIFYRELKSMLAKSIDIEKTITSELKKLHGIRIAFLFGSYAQGMHGTKSDIDLLIVGVPDMDKLNRVINRTEQKIKRPIQYTVYLSDEFKAKKRYGFIKNVMAKKKIFLIGDENELS